MNDLEKMIEKWKKIYKEKAEHLKRRNDRKYRIKRKRLIDDKKDNSNVEKIGE